MKIHRKLWIPVVLGAVALSLVSLGFLYVRLDKQSSQLKEDLPIVQQRLARLQLNDLIAQRTETQDKIAAADISLAAAKGSLTQQFTSESITARLYDIARLDNVSIVKATSPGLDQDDVSGVDLTSLMVAANVAGELPALLRYVNDLNAYFPTGSVQTVDFKVPESGSPTVQVTLLVFRYEGS